MKAIGIIVGVIVLSLVGFAIYAKSWWDNVSFDYKIDKTKINLQSILSDLISGKNITLPIILIIDNKNNSGISLTNVSLQINYNNEKVLQSDIINDLTIPAKAINFQKNLNITIFANVQSVKLIGELIKQTKPQVDIIFTFTKFKITKSFTIPYNLEY